MPRFIIYWKADNSRIPEDPKTRMDLFNALLQVTKKAMGEGLKDWGIHAEGGAGYAVFEGSEQELSLLMGAFIPTIIFDVHVVLNVDEQLQVFEKASQMQR